MTEPKTQTIVQWANRIVGYGEEDPALLLANPRNFRLHPQDQAEALAGILQQVGVVQDVIVNRTTGFLVDGHLRVALAVQQAQASIPVKYVELTPEEEAQVMLFLDRLTTMATIDKAKLQVLVAEVQSLEPKLQAALSQFIIDEKIIPPQVQFKEYDESAGDSVEYLECPNCHHKWPK